MGQKVITKYLNTPLYDFFNEDIHKFDFLFN